MQVLVEKEVVVERVVEVEKEVEVERLVHVEREVGVSEEEVTRMQVRAPSAAGALPVCCAPPRAHTCPA